MVLAHITKWNRIDGYSCYVGPLGDPGSSLVRVGDLLLFGRTAQEAVLICVQLVCDK